MLLPSPSIECGWMPVCKCVCVCYVIGVYILYIHISGCDHIKFSMIRVFRFYAIVCVWKGKKRNIGIDSGKNSIIFFLLWSSSNEKKQTKLWVRRIMCEYIKNIHKSRRRCLFHLLVFLLFCSLISLASLMCIMSLSWCSCCCGYYCRSYAYIYAEHVCARICMCII